MIWLPKYAADDAFYGQSYLKNPESGVESHVMDHKILAYHLIKLGGRQKYEAYQRNESDWTFINEDGQESISFEEFENRLFMIDAKLGADEAGMWGIVWNSDGVIRTKSSDYSVEEVVEVEFYLPINRLIGAEDLPSLFSNILSRLGALEQEVNRLKNPE